MKNSLKIFLSFLLMTSIDLFALSDGDFRLSRELMVKTQIEERGIKDRKVLKAMLKVERHKFVPKDLREGK